MTPPRVDPASCAFLLDVDGTLLSFAAQPDHARVDRALLELLTDLELGSGGAVALVSGRSIATLDAMFSPLRLPLSGLHGAELRTADGHCVRRAVDGAALQAARPLLAAVAAANSGLHLEDKQQALALHYRQAPRLAALVADALYSVAARWPAELAVLRGPMVYELTYAGRSKEDGVRELMASAPFQGRRPVYLGDDLLDEPAFTWVNAAGGVSIAVAARHATTARWRVPGVGAVREWLRSQLTEPPR